MRKSKLGLFSLFFAFSILVVGCGSKEEAGTNPAAVPTVEQGKFKFALSGMYKPYNYTDEKNQLTGFDVDIANEIGKRLGLEPAPAQTPWGSILQGLKADKYDAIVGSMAITDEREKEVDFSQPYYLSKAVIFVNEKNSKNIASKEDLTGKVVGVVTASTFKDAAKELVGPKGQVREYESDLMALQELKLEGRIDAVITDLGVGQHAIQVNQLPAIVVGDALFVDIIGIPVREGNKELLDAINKAIDDMKADGTYLEISNKWFNKDMLAED